MGKTKLDGTYIFKFSIKNAIFFYVTVGIKIPFFRVSVTIEPGHSVLQFVYHELFDMFLLKQAFNCNLHHRDKILKSLQ